MTMVVVVVVGMMMVGARQSVRGLIGRTLTL